MTDKDDKTAPDPNKVDAMKLSLMLTDLRLPTISRPWQSFARLWTCLLCALFSSVSSEVTLAVNRRPTSTLIGKPTY